MNEWPYIDLDTLYKFIDALFTGISQSYIVVSGSSKYDTQEESLNNLINAVNYQILKGFKPIGGIATADTDNYTGFYQAMINKGGRSNEETDKLQNRIQKSIQDYHNGCEEHIVLEKLKNGEYD